MVDYCYTCGRFTVIHHEWKSCDQCISTMLAVLISKEKKNIQPLD